jgi:thiol-disulfide isomerase/thioredoxin
LTLTPSALPSDHDAIHAERLSAGNAARQLLPAPDAPRPGFVLCDLQDAEQDLKRYAGRVVLVHFFATWCEPCREEFASLSLLVDGAAADRSFVVLAVNVAEVPGRVRRYLDAVPVKFPVLLDADRAVTRAWGVSILPTTFVLDRALDARLYVEGDLDWSRSDIRSALERVGATEPK